MEKAIITIGRQFGSGGKELGKELSQKLNIPFYDKELLYQAAKDAGMNPDFFVNNDERVPKFINGIIPFNFGVNPMPWHTGSAISDDRLYQAQSDFILDLAKKGPCIIVGRTADFVLRELPGVVSVFLTADIEDRAKRIVRRSECKDHAEAQKMAKRIDKLRANYYNFYSDKKWGDSATYDLTFNSSRLNIADIADIIVEYIKRR